MTRDGCRPATTRSQREDWQHVHRAGQDPPYPPGGPSPGPGPTGPGPAGPSPSGPGRDRLLALANPGICIYPAQLARQPGPRPEPTRPADTRPPRDPVGPAPEPEPEQPSGWTPGDQLDWSPPQPPPPPPPDPPPRPRVTAYVVALVPAAAALAGWAAGFAMGWWS